MPDDAKAFFERHYRVSAAAAKAEAYLGLDRRYSDHHTLAVWMPLTAAHEDPLIAHRFSRSRWRQAIATAKHQDRTHSIKVALDCGDGGAPER